MCRRSGLLSGGRWFCGLLTTTVLLAQGSDGAEFVRLEPLSTPEGYLARLLINENSFPGERGFVSLEDTKSGMLSVLWVLEARRRHVPPPYTQRSVAGVRSEDIIALITAPNQCEGFHRDASGRPAYVPRVERRVVNLCRIANSGEKPGRFAALLAYAQGLAQAQVRGGIEEADRFAGLKVVNGIPVTGRAYSWMTDMDVYHPGGSFVSIPDPDGGTLGGNRFFTLKVRSR